MKKAMPRTVLLSLAALFLLNNPCFAFSIFDSENLALTLDTYLRTDTVSFKNVVDLDSHNKDDHTTYMGIDYSLAFTLDLKKKDQKYYLKLERNGPYDYDAPLFIHNTLMPGGSHIDAYRNDELLPQAEEFWMDLPVPKIPLRFKAGLFTYEAGKGYCLGTGTYENYGVSLYKPGEDFNWRFHYLRPDFVYKNYLGPHIGQERDLGIMYEPNAANFFAFDAAFSYKENKFQPFMSLLVDRTSNGKRTDLFASPVHKEILGTIGLDYDVSIKDFSFGLEAARNFGQAESVDPAFKDVEHKGYLLYVTGSYTMGKFVPRCQFLFSSGNKVTADMVNAGLTAFPNGTNKAFSTYSPLNTNLFDSHSPIADSLPLVFFGWGYGLNYGVGINRPCTFADTAVLDNLIMPSLGFDYNFTDKLTATLDWWYIMADEKGVGMLAGLAKELSRHLGQEIDASLTYAMNDNINISLCTGYFFPGHFFKETRDDTGGSLFTPYVRGDGKADGAYQVELNIEFSF